MKASQILHVVDEGNGVNVLYLDNGFVVRLHVQSGTVYSASKLPGDEQINERLNNPPRNTATTSRTLG